MMKNAALQASACTNLGMWPAADRLESLRDFHLLQPAAWEGDGTGQGGCPSNAANFSSPTECWGWGFFFLQIRVVESREDFFFSFLLHSHTDEQPHRSGSLARFAFPGSAAGCRIWDQFVRNGSAEAHGEGISLISPLPIFAAVMGRSLLQGAKLWELHPALHDASPSGRSALQEVLLPLMKMLVRLRNISSVQGVWRKAPPVLLFRLIRESI